MQQVSETIINMNSNGQYFDPTEEYTIEFHPLQNNDDIETFYQEENYDDCDQTDSCQCDTCYYQE